MHKQFLTRFRSSTIQDGKTVDAVTQKVLEVDEDGDIVYDMSGGAIEADQKEDGKLPAKEVTQEDYKKLYEDLLIYSRKVKTDKETLEGKLEEQKKTTTDDKKTIANLEKRVQEKDREIADLQRELREANFRNVKLPGGLKKKRKVCHLLFSYPHLPIFH